jgi:hypothetical protein
MKVYIVVALFGDHEEGNLAVFSSEEQAEKYAAKIAEDKRFGYDEIVIEDHEIDAEPFDNEL